MNLAQAWLAVALVVLGGLGAFLILGLPLLRRLGDKVGGLFYPGDDGRPIRPEYSVAEARLKQNRFAEAIEEYRKVIAEHPTDIYAHVQIADIATEKLHDLPLAEEELLAATGKATEESGTMLAHGRLADLYQFKLNNPQHAVEVMEQLRAKLPGTRAAQRAEERIASLRKVLAGEASPVPPTKIAFRQVDEATRKKRRGY